MTEDDMTEDELTLLLAETEARNIEYLRADAGATRRLLDRLPPEAVVERAGLLSRLAEVEAEIKRGGAQ